MTEKINLTGYDLISSSSATSKGNQQKWLAGQNWYKADYMGYEGLCEVVISELLQKSNVKDFVIYHPIKIEFNEKTVNGCRSESFRDKNQDIITLERLSRMHLGYSFTRELLKYENTADKIQRTVNFIESVTDLKNIGEYITFILELDAFFLNEDRHTNNIAFIVNIETKKYKLCPYFDFGLSLLADTAKDYPMGNNEIDYINQIKAKPFSLHFDEQADCAASLYGSQLKLFFNKQDVNAALDKLREYYSEDIISRVRNLIFNQMRKYQYMFYN